VLVPIIDKAAATAIARDFLSRLQVRANIDLALQPDSTIERDFGWVFFYNSTKYLETKNFRDAVAGNAPLIVDRDDGSVHLTGTADPVETYIERYERDRRARARRRNE
jgi:immunity protein 35 of polymorphic toxin system